VQRAAGWAVYAIRWAANATVAPGWRAGGSIVAAGSADQTAPDRVADAGGAFVVWQDGQVGSSDVRALHLDASGSPVAGWPGGGALVCGATGEQSAPRVAVSGGDAFVVWADTRDGGLGPALYAQRLLSGGPIPV